jgi:AcrR family transcriptional regulator
MFPVPRIWDESVASHKARLRATIVEAAVALAAERGRGGVSMSAVAERAGIGRATLYNYFADVDHILGAYVVDAFERFNAELDAMLAELDDPLEQLRTTVVATVTYLGSPEHARGVRVGNDHFGPQVQAVVDEALDGYRRRLNDVVAAGVAAGALRADVGPVFLGHALEHLLAAANQSLVAGEQPPEAAAETVLTVFLHGASASAGRAAASRRRTRRRAPPAE